MDEEEGWDVRYGVYHTPKASNASKEWEKKAKQAGELKRVCYGGIERESAIIMSIISTCTTILQLSSVNWLVILGKTRKQV